MMMIIIRVMIACYIGKNLAVRAQHGVCRLCTRKYARAAQQQRLMFIIENTEYIQQQYNEPM